jgi:hypothetical protein
MLQMFSLNIVKVDTVLYMLQWTLFTVTAYYSCWACMHVGVEETRAAGVKNRADADRDKHGAGTGHEAAQDRMRRAAQTSRR